MNNNTLFLSANKSIWTLTLAIFMLVFITGCGSEPAADQQGQQSVNTETAQKKKQKKNNNKKKAELKQESNRTVVTAPQEIQQPDTRPLYPGCTQKNYEKRKACSNQKLIDMLHRVVKHPDMRLEENPAGVVLLSFTVAEDGTMSDLKLEKSLSPQCDEAARAAIEEMFNLSGPWEPATLDGKKVAARYSLPIQFSEFE